MSAELLEATTVVIVVFVVVGLFGIKLNHLLNIKIYAAAKSNALTFISVSLVRSFGRSFFLFIPLFSR